MQKTVHKIANEIVPQATDALVVTLDDEGSVLGEKLVQVIATLPQEVTLTIMFLEIMEPQ